MFFYRFLLPAYDRRGELAVAVAVASRIIGDDVSEFHSEVVQAAAAEGYEVTPLRWEHREVSFCVGVDTSAGA